MSCKINVLERVKEASFLSLDVRVTSTLKMAARYIESLEKNLGFGAQLRAQIASEQMANDDSDYAIDKRAASAVRAADALLKELTKNDHQDLTAE